VNAACSCQDEDDVVSIKVVAGAVKTGKTGQARSEPEGDGWRLLINQFSVVQPQ
jgi:hypothetical protein